MQSELEKYLKSINLNEYYLPVFEHVEIEKAEKDYTNNEIRLFLKTDELFDVEIYKDLYNKKDSRFATSIHIRSLVTPSDEVLTKYYQFFISLVYKGLLINQLVSKKVEIYDDSLVIQVSSLLEEDAITQVSSKLESLFRSIDINYSIKIILFDESMNNMNKVVEEENSVVKTVSHIDEHVQPKFDSNKNFYNKEYKAIEIDQVESEDERIEIVGRVFDKEEIVTRNGTKRYSIYLTNDKSSLLMKAKESKNISSELLDEIKVGDYLCVRGGMSLDYYSHEDVLTPYKIENLGPKEERIDDYPEKRVELHLHSKMSAMDGVTSITDYINRAITWGHKAIALTDHASVQAVPEAQDASDGKDIKLIYGMEGYVVDNKRKPAIHQQHIKLSDATYVVFDLETTGLSSRYDKITELGFVKVKNGIVIDTFSKLVNPLMKLHKNITNKTKISNEMLSSCPTIDKLLPELLSFIGDSILVAHNGTFDIGFLDEALLSNGYPKLKNPVIETRDFAACVFPDLSYHSLGRVCKYLNIDYDEDEAHRADYDAKVLSDCLSFMISKAAEMGVYYHDELNNLSPIDSYKKEKPYHMTFLAKNKSGLKDLYKMLSKASTEYVTNLPLIPKDLITQYRKDLFVGSGCFNGEVFETASTKSFNELKEVIEFYDYIEIQPLQNYEWLLKNEVILEEERLINILKDIVKAAKEVGKIVVATGDTHYLDPRDKIFRDVYVINKTTGQRMHPLNKPIYPYSPAQHFRTTREMIEGISFLNDLDLQKELVITNTNLIADQIESYKPLMDHLCTPHLKDVNTDEEIRRMCIENAHKLYGENLPKLIEDRMNHELNNIINNGYSVIYYLAYKLVNKSNSDGYIVGSRGSVGSSFVASLCKITEVNPLPPHYLCPKCHHIEFFDDGSVRSGFDLPEKMCPDCGTIMNTNGQNIPFETFLGLHCDKVPDIDLNFSRDYQPIAHDYTKVLCGENNVYRAGTISTVASRTAFGYARGYYELHGLELPKSAELHRLAVGCEKVKRTTGQHPAGIIVVPDDMEIYDFTPIQYPADDPNNRWMTTSFKFESMHDSILKLDILGHLDPMVLKVLRDLTGIDPEDIPMNDPRVYSLFQNLDELDVKDYEILNEIGTSGIPEFGTAFVKGVVQECKPTKFSDLVQISGLTHGKQVYQGNAQDLIKNGTCNIETVIGCRDDIMTDLINYGLDKKDAFNIMEFVRKGKPTKNPDKWLSLVDILKKNNVPDWYIDSCSKINYMFPKAHAVAYVVMALRIAWFKVHYPLEYYAAYFSVRSEQFDIGVLLKGKEAIMEKVKELRTIIQTSKDVSKTIEELHETMELGLEMCARGFKFSNVSLTKSLSNFFVVDKENNALIAPFCAVKGLGEAAAASIIEARNESPFITKEDFQQRTKVNRTNIKNLEDLGVFDELHENVQMKIDFDF